MATNNWVNMGSRDGFMHDSTSHYLNQCWLTTSEFLWNSIEDNFTGKAQYIRPQYEFEITSFNLPSYILEANELKPMLETGVHMGGIFIL